MFAVIATGGKQYKVTEGTELQIELLDYGKAKTLKLEKVLLCSKNGSTEVGRPFLKGAFCEAEILKEEKAPKVISYKYIRREKAQTKIGHRQKYLKIKITSIQRGS